MTVILKYVALGGCAGLTLLVSGCALFSAPERSAERHVNTLTEEIRATISSREITKEFAMYEAYSADRLEASSGTNTYSDKTGNCRLSWFDYLLRHPIESIAEAEAFTWQLNQDAQQQDALQRLVATAAAKLDVPFVETAARRPAAGDPGNHLSNAYLRIISAAMAMEQAYAPLTEAAYKELEDLLYEQSTGSVTVGHRFADKEKGRRVCDLLEQMDRHALLEAADQLARLADDRELLNGLAGLADPGPQTVKGVTGDAEVLNGPAGGRILIGGRGANHYELEELADVLLVIDLGGNDTYVEGTVGRDRPVLVVIDLGGDDHFKGELPGIQGGAILGASMLINLGGNDRFEAGDVAQGSALAGVGILVSEGGNDHYTGRCRVQGQALAGVGLLLDGSGDDHYRAALLAQGVGGPLGFGALIDRDGDDAYYAGGLYPGNYSDSPGYGAWSQGVGVGPRGSANGGIGVILDSAGNDTYEYDYFSHGGGYWFAAGFARDFGGDDQRLGATRTQFDGSPREVRPFVRWGVGYGCHYALGFVIDDEGDDTYVGDTASVAFSWDIAVGAILDFAGNDHYKSLAGIATAANAGLAVLLDSAGDDRYEAGYLASARGTVAYHPIEKAGGNFAFLLDYGGQDDFGKAAANNREAANGWAGAVFISRPAPLK